MAGKRLFPTAEVPTFIQESERYDEKYKPSVAWDIGSGDFVRTGANRMVEAGGRDAYKVWCYKAVSTERFAHLAYPASIGTEIGAAMKEKSNEAVELAVERTVTEALMVNPRTEYVRDFEFAWDGDGLRCSFAVKAVALEEFPLEVTFDSN